MTPLKEIAIFVKSFLKLGVLLKEVEINLKYNIFNNSKKVFIL